MKWKGIVISCAILILVGTATVVADQAYEWLKGKQMSVSLNNEVLSNDGWLLYSNKQSKAYLPLRDIAESMQAIIQWDPESNTARLYKPNVHMAFNFNRKDGSLGTFGKVTHNREFNFFIFTQIDHLEVDVHSLKYEIEAPNGEVVYSYEEPLENQNDLLIWNYSPDIQLKFSQKGEYQAKIYMNLESDGDYFLVSQKALYSSVEE